MVPVSAQDVFERAMVAASIESVRGQATPEGGRALAEGKR